MGAIFLGTCPHFIHRVIHSRGFEGGHAKYGLRIKLELEDRATGRQIPVSALGDLDRIQRERAAYAGKQGVDLARQNYVSGWTA
jgi:hypothetical protein